MANTALAPNLPTKERTTCHRHSHGGPWISTYLHCTDIYRELLQAGVRGALQERAADARHARHHLQSQREYCIYYLDMVRTWHRERMGRLPQHSITTMQNT